MFRKKYPQYILDNQSFQPTKPGHSMVQWSAHQPSNPEGPGSSPGLTTFYFLNIFFLQKPKGRLHKKIFLASRNHKQPENQTVYFLDLFLQFYSLFKTSKIHIFAQKQKIENLYMAALRTILSYKMNSNLTFYPLSIFRIIRSKIFFGAKKYK